MVNLLPEKMKKGVSEDRGFDIQKHNKEGVENVPAGTFFKDKLWDRNRKGARKKQKMAKKEENRKRKQEKNRERETEKEKERMAEEERKKQKMVEKEENRKRETEKEKERMAEEERKKQKMVEKEENRKREKKNSSPITETFSKEFSLNKNKKERKTGEDFTDNLGVSLMPRQTMVISRVVHSRLLFLIVAILTILILFFISRLYGNWYFNKLEYQTEYLKREIVLLEAQTKPFLENRDNVSALTDKATEVKKILDNHIYWTNFFDFLEIYTIPNVYFGDFSAQSGERVQMIATSRDLMSLAQQIVAFDNAEDFIQESNVSNIQKSDEGVNAFFDLLLVEGIWQK